MKIRLSIRTGHWLLDTIANFRPSNKKKYVRNKACLIRLAIQLCTADEGPLCVTAYHLRLSSHHSTKYYGTDSCALKPGLPVDSSFWFCQNLEFFPLECWVFSWILQRIVSVIDNCHFEQGKLEFHIELFIFWPLVQHIVNWNQQLCFLSIASLVLDFWVMIFHLFYCFFYC